MVVQNSLSLKIERLTAALCAALMLFYAATIPAKAANEIQHTPALMAEHDHSGIAGFSIDAVHDNDGVHAQHHEGTPEEDDQTDDRVVGGHHHHGDSGSSLLVANAATAVNIAPSGSLHDARSERPISGLRSPGPERPPRSISLTV